MKKLLLVFELLCTINVAIFSQEEADKKFTIQTSPASLINGLVNLGSKNDSGPPFMMDLEGQYKINEFINVSLTVSFLTHNQIVKSERTVYDGTDEYGYPTYYDEYYTYKNNWFQFNFKPMFIYRPFKTGLEGFYIGIYPNIGWQTQESRDKDYLWTEIGTGINTGYKWVFKKGFTLQLGCGFGKTWSIPEKPENFGIIFNSDGRLTLKNFDIHIVDFKMGWSF